LVKNKNLKGRNNSVEWDLVSFKSNNLQRETNQEETSSALKFKNNLIEADNQEQRERSVNFSSRTVAQKIPVITFMNDQNQGRNYQKLKNDLLLLKGSKEMLSNKRRVRKKLTWNRDSLRSNKHHLTSAGRREKPSSNELCKIAFNQKSLKMCQ